MPRNDVKLKDYREDLLERLREEPEYWMEYLSAALEQGDPALSVAVGDVLEAKKQIESRP